MRRMRIEEGRAKECTVLLVRSSGSLQLDILPDMGLDIGQLNYRGGNISYMSKNGYDIPACFYPMRTTIFNTFPVACCIPAGCILRVLPTVTGTNGFHCTDGFTAWARLML